MAETREIIPRRREKQNRESQTPSWSKYNNRCSVSLNLPIAMIYFGKKERLTNSTLAKQQFSVYCRKVKVKFPPISESPQTSKFLESLKTNEAKK